MRLSPYCHRNVSLSHKDITTAKANVPYFNLNQIKAIYKFPSPNLATKTVVGVISFGGGLVGTVSASGILTGGDVQSQWTYLGISSANFPQVVVVPIGGATNSPNPSDGATIENTIDIETIGALYPSSNLTIILYIAPNTLSGFTQLLNAVATPITINGTPYKPSVVSCSWGAPEKVYSRGELASINSQLQALAANGITVTTASGDNGSSDGLPGINVDFPSSSPYVLACGGTTLVCPNYTYDASTRESAWSSGGGGISAVFSKPSYQSAIGGSYRNTPDIALNANPNTGVIYTVGNTLEVVGGTSIVSPAMAAFIAILNTGTFITSLLYGFPSTNYHDIISGSNGQYSTKTGYDNCTGWGSIVGDTLAASIRSPSVPVTGVTLSPSVFILLIGTTVQLTATVAPANASNKTVSYSSSNTAVATVNQSGLVTGVSAGSTVITVTTVNGNYSTTANGTIQITVPTSVSINPSVASVNVGRTTSLSAIILPTNSSNKSVTWASSNTSVATVNSSGIVSGIKNGSATITVTTASGGLQNTCALSVLTPVSGITVTPASVTLSVGRNATIIAAVSPTSASNKTVSWISQNIGIATVSAGVVSGVKKGTTRVVATAGAFSATVTVTVN